MMQQQWISFLQNCGAKTNDQQIVDFGDPVAELDAATLGNCLYELNTLGLIRVSGEDATVFLQNQLSNDIKNVTADQTQLSAYCSAKGRVLSLFRIIADGDGYLLQMPQERVSSTLKRLSMYVLMSKVVLSDATNELCSMGISGLNAQSALNTIGDISTLGIHDSIKIDQYIIFRSPGATPRFTLISDADSLQSFWRNHQSEFRPVGFSAWLAIDIQAGLPHIYENTSEEFVPQMLNLNSLDAISYTKGCYPGQEVVARMHYLGKQKRRMFLGEISSELAPSPGDNLFVDKIITEQSVGKIVHSALNKNGNYDALAVIQIKHTDKDSLFVNSNQENPFTIKELPYIVELEGSKQT